MWVGVVRFVGVGRVDGAACGTDGILDDVVDLGPKFLQCCPSVERNLIQKAALGTRKPGDTSRQRQEAEDEDSESGEDELGLHKCDGGECVKECNHEQTGQEKVGHLVRYDLHCKWIR